jgi:TonB family protein
MLLEILNHFQLSTQSNMSMRHLFLLTLVIGIKLTACNAQDTVRLFLNDKYEIVKKKEKAVFIREAFFKQGIYHITDKYLDGQLIVYGEYISVDPWVEHGYFRYYNEIGYLYAEGKYENGNFVGDWIYYDKKSPDTVKYEAASKILSGNSWPADLPLASISASQGLMEYVYNELHFPARARDLANEKMLIINLIRTGNGELIPEIKTSPHKDLNYELTRVLLNAPDSLLWGNIDDPKANSLNLMVDFNLPVTVDTSLTAFVFVEYQATFQDGDVGTFRQYIQENLKIPDEVNSDSLYGRVTLQFMVRYDGKVDFIKILRSSGHKILDDIAITAVRNSPAWQPAKQGNVVVSQQFVIPVTFVLNH